MSDNDYTRLADGLESVVNTLEGLSVPDADLDDAIYNATDALKTVRDKARERE